MKYRFQNTIALAIPKILKSYYPTKMKVLLSVFNFEATESGHSGKCNKKFY